MLRIEKELFQWEKDRYVYITQSNTEIVTVEFYNKKSDVAMEVYVTSNKAKIPNELLKENLPITAIACADIEKGNNVVARKTFKVLARPKPQYYVDDSDNPDIPGIDVVYDGGVEE